MLELLRWKYFPVLNDMTRAIFQRDSQQVQVERGIRSTQGTPHTFQSINVRIIFMPGLHGHKNGFRHTNAKLGQNDRTQQALQLFDHALLPT